MQSEAGRTISWMVFGLEWGLVLVSTFTISHAHLFGVSRVPDYLQRRQPSEPGFQTPGLYRHMRSPIMTGFFIASFATPQMSAGHFVFALVTTVCFLVAL